MMLLRKVTLNTLKKTTEAHFTSTWQHVCLLNHKDDLGATTARTAASVYERSQVFDLVSIKITLYI